jgi:hypothetical protein
LTTRADVLTHDAMAWALAASGDFAAAQIEMSAALAEHTRDARMFLHAAEIAHANGQAAAALRYLDSAHCAAGTLTPSERDRFGAILAECGAGSAAAASDARSREAASCDGLHR